MKAQHVYLLQTEGVTFPNVMFIRGGHQPYASPSADRGQFYQFAEQIGLLNHEMRHIKQYKDKRNSAAAFGWQYLYEWCIADWNYDNIPLEIDARRYEDRASGLLQSRNLPFFERWRIDNLKRTIGFPTSVSVVPTRIEGITRDRLPFQVGIMDMVDRRVIGGSVGGRKLLVDTSAYCFSTSVLTGYSSVGSGNCWRCCNGYSQCGELLSTP